eukprot:CAMPEP_0115887228 /NCGR_PEP_ID=MMETSP0287-20121206/31651_1 /TAXON_ID=412157 /ORGANISM="Chrysochromulina rotalis, Strain UIO044" /LENGTH=41 /DNA_ID= /DNA_START= /DNA_END= /DNA_ORIENTATION=
MRLHQLDREREYEERPGQGGGARHETIIEAGSARLGDDPAA